MVRDPAPEPATPDVSARLFGVSALFVAASALAAVVALAVGVWLRGRTTLAMDDLIDVTNPSYPKQIDLWVIAVWALVAGGLSLFGLALPGLRRAADAAGAWLSEHATWLVWLAVAVAPAIPLVTNLADQFPAAHVRGAVTAAWFVAVGVVLAVLARRHALPTGQVLTTAALLLGGILGAWTALSVMAAGLAPSLTWPWWPVAFMATVLGVATMAWAVRASLRLRHAGLVAEVLIPLLLFVLVAPLGAATTSWLIGAVALLVAALVLRAVRRARAEWHSEGPVLHRDGIAVLAAYVTGLLRLPSGGVPTDEYHWGEMLVQWDQVVAHGSTPFADYIPAPGLNGFVYGAVNQLVGGDAITFQRAVQLSAALMAAAMVLIAVKVVGAHVALLLVPTAAALAGGGVADRFAGLALSVLILAIPALWRRSVGWLASWLLLLAGNLLFIPSSGTAFLVASIPAVVMQAVRGLRSWRRVRAGEYVALAVALGATLLLAGTLRDLLSFVATQGAANTVAWGLPLLPWQTPAESVYIAALNVIRSAGWWLGVPIAGALIVAFWRIRPQRGVSVLAGSTVLLAAALTPYVFGRIERSGMSRVGLASIVILGLLIPLAVRGVRAHLTGVYGTTLVRTSAVVVMAAVGIPAAVLMQGFGPYRPMAGTVVDGPAIGLPQLGVGPAAQADSLILRQEMVAAVADGDVVVDLANRQAWYFYAGVPQPTTVGAYWNMVGQQEQEAVIGDLVRSRPVIVFPDTVDPAEPGFWEPTMRAYRVTRWLWENGYRAYDFAGQTVLLSPEGAARADERFRVLTPAEADDRLVGSYPRLGEMFAAWGSTWERLQGRLMQVPAEVAVSGTSAVLTVSESTARPDALLVDVQCEQAPVSPAVLSWPLADGSVHERTLPLQPGRSLIPLGAFPSWSDDPETGEVTITVADGCLISEPPQLLRLER